SPRRFHSVAGASPRKSRPPSFSSPLMKVHISPAWISPSMGAWRRSSKECEDQVVRKMEKNRGGVRAATLKLDMSKKSTFESFAQEAKSGLRSVWTGTIGRDPM